MPTREDIVKEFMDQEMELMEDVMNLEDDLREAFITLFNIIFSIKKELDNTGLSADSKLVGDRIDKLLFDGCQLGEVPAVVKELEAVVDNYIETQNVFN